MTRGKEQNLMTTAGAGRNRRRRGRRGQRGRPEHEEQQATHDPQEAAAQPRQQAPAVAVEVQQRTDAPGRGSEDQQGERRSSSRKRSRGRRARTTRRPTLDAIPTIVLKEHIRNVPVTGTMVTRSLEDAASSTGITFGCPMLTRTRLGMPFRNGLRMPRCSMGWAVHNEEEVSFCMRTPDLLDCWKLHSEREAALRASDEDKNAAD
jgi:hypothetical protein